MSGKIFSLRTLLISLWLIAIGAGFAAVWRYQNTGLPADAARHQWPAKSSLNLDTRHDTLVMFAHPQCPCTRASIEELNRLLAQVHDQVTAQVLFYQPSTLPQNWSQTDLWRNAAAIPGVTVKADVDGHQAGLFGVQTSGSVLLFDPQGRLLFSGGITAGRGHDGDNAGESTILSLCAGRPADTRQTPVFGCSLFGQCDKPVDGDVK